jgi:peptide/nickel transport system substrate-binding protein
LCRAANPARKSKATAGFRIIYLWTPRNIVGLSNKVAGFTLLADGLLRLQDVRLAQ